ncbi:hypothetical protein ACQCT5_10540 [Sutcliffiella halmapala]
MRKEMEVGDQVRNHETGLVGVLKKLDDSHLYYVEGNHEIAGKWVTGYDHLWKFKKSWQLYIKKKDPQ